MVNAGPSPLLLPVTFGLFFDDRNLQGDECRGKKKMQTCCPNTTVLCFDSDPTLLAWLQLLLSIAGYEVRTATSVDCAMQDFGADDIDVVIIVPDDDWIWLGCQMKRLKPTVPIVLLNRGRGKLPPGAEYADVIFSRGVTPTVFLATLAEVTTRPQPNAGASLAAGLAQ